MSGVGAAAVRGDLPTAPNREVDGEAARHKGKKPCDCGSSTQGASEASMVPLVATVVRDSIGGTRPRTIMVEAALAQEPASVPAGILSDLKKASPAPPAPPPAVAAPSSSQPSAPTGRKLSGLACVREPSAEYEARQHAATPRVVGLGRLGKIQMQDKLGESSGVIGNPTAKSPVTTQTLGRWQAVVARDASQRKLSAATPEDRRSSTTRSSTASVASWQKVLQKQNVVTAARAESLERGRPVAVDADRGGRAPHLEAPRPTSPPPHCAAPRAQLGGKMGGKPKMRKGGSNKEQKRYSTDHIAIVQVRPGGAAGELGGDASTRGPS